MYFRCSEREVRSPACPTEFATQPVHRYSGIVGLQCCFRIRGDVTDCRRFEKVGGERRPRYKLVRVYIRRVRRLRSVVGLYLRSNRQKRPAVDVKPCAEWAVAIVLVRDGTVRDEN